MGFFADHFQANYEDHLIEIEARFANLFGSVQYDLVVNNKRIDRIEGMLGTFYLRGHLEEKTIKVTVKQGLAGTRYQLSVDGLDIPLEKKA